MDKDRELEFLIFPYSCSLARHLARVLFCGIETICERETRTSHGESLLKLLDLDLYWQAPALGRFFYFLNVPRRLRKHYESCNGNILSRATINGLTKSSPLVGARSMT